MKIIKSSYEIITPIDGKQILQSLELPIRNCYKSEDKITEDSYKKIIPAILSKNHLSTIEHISLTVKLICDRGVMAEITRHRLASFSVESTRYCNYSKDKFGSEITVIEPPNWHELSNITQVWWINTMEHAEEGYKALLEKGWTPQMARDVLPNALKTEIYMTCNLREWRHVFYMRCSPQAHPAIRHLLTPLLKEFSEKIPYIFDDLKELYITEVK